MIVLDSSDSFKWNSILCVISTHVIENLRVDYSSLIDSSDIMAK